MLFQDPFIHCPSLDRAIQYLGKVSGHGVALVAGGLLQQCSERRARVLAEGLICAVFARMRFARMLCLRVDVCWFAQVGACADRADGNPGVHCYILACSFALPTRP